MPQPSTKAERNTYSRPGLLRRAASSIARLLERGNRDDRTPAIRAEAAPERIARHVHRQTDIPLDIIENAYIPKQTSLKSSFRTSGEDRQRDQEFAHGVADERWNDEDRLTNKSGDPRIGTHGRTYEPGEARAASSRNDKTTKRRTTMDEQRTNKAGFGTQNATDSDTTFRDSNKGITSATETETCAHCGQSLNQNRGLEDFLQRIGISEEMISNLRVQMQNVDIEEYLDTAREYLKTAGGKVKETSDKATKFAKDNPGKIAAGVAVIAVGAGLLLNSLRGRD